jgi:hypothetical protein
MSQIVQIRFNDGVRVEHERVFNCAEEGSFYKVRELNKTFLYPTKRIYTIAIEENESYHG